MDGNYFGYADRFRLILNTNLSLAAIGILYVLVPAFVRSAFKCRYFGKPIIGSWTAEFRVPESVMVGVLA